MTDKDVNLDDMASEIYETEKQLSEMKKAYREKKYEGLKMAVDARKSATEAINEELKALGYGKLPTLVRSGSVWW